MTDEYEILPYKLLEDLKYDVEALKKKLSEPETATQELIAEIEDLKSDIKDLHNLFQETLQEVREDDSSKLLASLQHKIEAVTTQNETIARGMVAISDKLEDFMKRPASFAPRMSPPSTPSSPGGPSHMAPRPLNSLNLPPPPKSPRHGIFK